MVQAIYDFKRKVVTVRVSKTCVATQRGRFDDQSIYPIPLLYDELGWKLAVGFDPACASFTLHVNDVPFLGIPL